MMRKGIARFLQTEYEKTLPENRKTRTNSVSHVAGKLLVFFFITMLLFTFVSRATASFTVARVIVENPRRDVLNHTLTGIGKISMEKEMIINVIPGYHIDKVNVAVGDAVTSDTVLFQYRMEDLQKKFDTIHTAIEKLQISIQQAQLSITSSVQKTSQSALLSYRQAKDNLDVAFINLSEAEQDYRKSLHKSDGSADYDAVLEGKKQAVNAAKEAARVAEQVVFTSKQQYELALQNDAAQQALNEKNNRNTELTIQSYQLDLSENEKELALIQKLLDSSGEVTSPTKGIVSYIGLEAGRITTGEETIKLGAGNYVIKAEYTRDQGVDVEIGSKVKVTKAGENSSIDTEIYDFTVNEVGIPAFVAALPDGKYLVGETMKFKVTTQSKRFDLCVPLTALHEGGGTGYYIFVTKEQKDILGTELIATSVAVDVIDKDNLTAAIAGSLSQSDNVIIDSNKYIKEDDRVRLK